MSLPALGRTFVVTGASSGIGRAVAEGLARKGGRVVLVCRSRERGQAVQRELGSRFGGAPAELVVADLGSVEGARAAARGIHAVAPRIDVLLHNAGAWPTSLVTNAEGFEAAFALNVLAPFVLNEALLPSLEAGAPARIVQVTAGLYGAGRIDLDATPRGRDFHRLRTYATTKLWNLLTTLELARRVAGTAVTVTAVHPGVVRTALGDMPGLTGRLLRAVKRLWATPETGALGPVHAALVADPTALHGAYFDRLTPQPLRAPATDEALREAVWNRTAALVGR